MRSNAFGGVFVGCWAFVQIRGVYAVRSSKNRPRALFKPCYKRLFTPFLFFCRWGKGSRLGSWKVVSLESYARGRGGSPRFGASLKGYELKQGKEDPPTRPRYNVYKSFGVACVYWVFGLFLVGASVGWSVSVGCVEAVRWVSACGKIRTAFGVRLN